MRAIYKPLTVALLATTLIACGTSDDDDDDVGRVDPGNIVEVARADGSFTTLVAALEASGLDAALADETRDFTVFAPTDAAFTAALTNLGITAADLLASPNLQDILLYHVVADAEIGASAAIAAAGTTVTTANEDEIGVSLRGGDLFINASRLEAADVDASNGVIHVIDAVLLPTEDDPASGSITAVAAAKPGLSTLVLALQTAMLDGVAISVLRVGQRREADQQVGQLEGPPGRLAGGIRGLVGHRWTVGHRAHGSSQLGC